MRTLYYILCASVIAIALGVGLYYFGPPSLQAAFTSSVQNNSTPAPVSVPITILRQGTNALSVTDRINYRITNTTDLQSLWLLVYGQDDAHPVPTIDFTTSEVLGVFDGTHATGGYAITVSKVQDQAPIRMVTIEHDVPGAGCATSSGVTSPFEIIEVSKTLLSISHTDISATSTCSQ